jgi:hypothetical protein
MDAMTDYASLKSFSPEFAAYFAAAPMDELLDGYCESYKDAHGIKARWVYNSGMSRDELARAYDRLAGDIKAENERQEAADAAFRNRIAALGLSDWAERNGIRSEYDLWDHNDRVSWEAKRDPEPLPYEDARPILH